MQCPETFLKLELLLFGFLFGFLFGLLLMFCSFHFGFFLNCFYDQVRIWTEGLKTIVKKLYLYL